MNDLADLKPFKISYEQIAFAYILFYRHELEHEIETVIDAIRNGQRVYNSDGTTFLTLRFDGWTESFLFNEQGFIFRRWTDELESSNGKRKSIEMKLLPSHDEIVERLDDGTLYDILGEFEFDSDLLQQESQL